MTDPFVQPAEPRAAAAVAAINEELCLFDDWMDRYEFIIGMGRKLPPFPDDWANDSHRVPGCQSRVWMEAIPRDGKLDFSGLSGGVVGRGDLVGVGCPAAAGLFRPLPAGNPGHRSGIPEGPWVVGGTVHQPR